MPDVTVKHLDELERYGGETGGSEFLYAGRSLGVTSFGLNVERFPAGWERYPEHDHDADGQEEVYVVLEGSATLEADGEQFELAPGALARVGAGQTRRIVPGDSGVTLIALGGTPGKPFTSSLGS